MKMFLMKMKRKQCSLPEADDVGDSGPGQPLTEDEHGPDRDDRTVGEARECLIRVDEAGERERAQHEQRHEVHPNDFTDEENQRDAKDDQDNGDVESHYRIYTGYTSRGIGHDAKR